MAFTGASPSEAASFLDMSGGDVSLAVDLFFGGGAMATSTTSHATAHSLEAEAGEFCVQQPPWFTAVWGSGGGALCRILAQRWTTDYEAQCWQTNSHALTVAASAGG